MKLVEIKDKKRFFNINQKYLFEMTAFYPQDFDEFGNLSYLHLDDYFIGDKTRYAYYLEDEVEGEIKEVGFLMINNYSHLGNKIDYAMAEFCIYPSYRRLGMGKKAVKEVLTKFRGSWEIKYNIKNEKANCFWHKVLKTYKITEIKYSDDEMIICFDN